MRVGDLIISKFDRSMVWHPRMGNHTAIPLPQGVLGVVVSTKGRFNRALFYGRVCTISPYDFRVLDDEG
jgi:hypothetical protein